MTKASQQATAEGPPDPVSNHASAGAGKLHGPGRGKRTESSPRDRLLGDGVPGDIVGLPRAQLAVLPGSTHVTLTQKSDWLVSMANAFLDAPPRRIHITEVRFLKRRTRP